MNEEEILKRLNDIIQQCHNSRECQENKFCSDCYIEIEDIQAIQGLLDLYQKEKEKNKKYKDVISSLNNNWVSKAEIKAKIEERDIRIDYLDKELAEAYIAREKLGTETGIDFNEQYIYNMEQERSIRHTEKRVLQSLLEEE